jgi:polyketide cyclase/dehydrase/lipid transport protein
MDPRTEDAPWRSTRTHRPPRKARSRSTPILSVISAIGEWPSWNPDIKSVTLEGPVQPGSFFRWRSGPSPLTSTLQVVDPPNQIAWTGTTMGIKAIHVFRFEAKDGGTLVACE